MERAKLAFAVVSFILNSGVLGRTSRFCALKGTSVDLPCSGKPPPAPKGFRLEGSSWTEVSVDGPGAKYKISDSAQPTLSVWDLNKDDTGFYCCADTPESCQEEQTELVVTALQVRALPSADGQTVTLTCSSTACALSDKPAAYIWYKNQEVLYRDWSPWYQELVPSERADRYSCAIEGFEGLPAPAVTVESVSSTCFTVSYAEGRMCLYNQTTVRGPCSITYPTELQVVKITKDKNHISLMCNTSCPPTNTQWYENNRERENPPEPVPTSSEATFLCAAKNNRDLQSAEVCAGDKSCRTLYYVKNRICALEGSSVNISSEYSGPNYAALDSTRWHRISLNGEKETLMEPEDYEEKNEEQQKSIHTLTIKSVRPNDSAEYRFRFQGDEKSQKPGAILIVTDVRVKFSPSAEATEGQSVRLTCSTHCPLTHNSNYIWYRNHQPLPEHQNKHLLLDPVTSQHAGSYSCSVATRKRVRSPEKTLEVQRSWMRWREAAAAAGAGAAALLFITLAVVCWIRRNRKPSKSTVLHLEETNASQMYEEIPEHPREQSDGHYSSIWHPPQAGADPLYTAVQPQQHRQEKLAAYAVVSLSDRCA